VLGDVGLKKDSARSRADVVLGALRASNTNNRRAGRAAC
jgi:hypothetical protein